MTHPYVDHPTRRRLPRRVTLQCVMGTDDGRAETVTDIVPLKQASQGIEPLGLTLAAATQRLTTIPQRGLAQQVNTFLASHAHCETCGTVLKVKSITPARSGRCLAPVSSPVPISPTFSATPGTSSPSTLSLSALPLLSAPGGSVQGKRSFLLVVYARILLVFSER